MLIKYIKLKVKHERGRDKLTFTAKRRGNNPETEELGSFRIADMFLSILLKHMRELESTMTDVFFEVYSMNVSSKNINDKDIILFLGYRKDESLDISPCQFFWDCYEGLENNVSDEIGVKIWR